MIISEIGGGFGNQLFDYACAYAQSRRLNCKLVLDAMFLATDPLRNYELDALNIRYGHALRIPKHLPYWLKVVVRKSCHLVLPLLAKQYDEKQTYIFDDDIEKLRGSWRLHGYWQSEKYFRVYRDEILEMLTPNYRLTGSFVQLLNRIISTESVSVHVRRGDYVALGICLGDEYYEKALKQMCERVKNPVFYVFSDDLGYAKGLFERINATTIFVVYEAKNSTIEDFLLMKSCRHNIIANSSYSWWGAWANANEDKIVICPKRTNDDFYPKERMQL